MFYVGDLVSVMDEDVTGFLTRVDFNENKVFLDYCGMELCFSFSQIVKIDKSFDEKVAKGKITAKDNIVKTYKTKKSKSINSILKVDLHSHNLKGCRIGMTSHDVLLTQLDKCKHTLLKARTKMIQKVVFIHGIGKGRLKSELHSLLKQQTDLEFYDANFSEFGKGATEVRFFHSKKSI